MRPEHEARFCESAESLYRQAFQEIAAIVFLTDARAIIVDASGAAASFLNVNLDFLQGKPLLHFVARRDTRGFRERIDGLPSAMSPFVAALRPRGGKPCAMTMTVARLRGRSLFVWMALPDIHAELSAPQPSSEVIPRDPYSHDRSAVTGRAAIGARRARHDHQGE